MFKLYWFNILKLKETPENKAKIKMLEARKKKKESKGKKKKKGGTNEAQKISGGISGTVKCLHMAACVCKCLSGVREKLVPTGLMGTKRTGQRYCVTVRALSYEATRQRREKPITQHSLN